MGRYDDIDPMDIDPDTNRPYSNYSSPSLDTSFHDLEMAGEEDECEDDLARKAGIAACAAGAPISSNPFVGSRGEAWKSGWRDECAFDEAEGRAEIADRYGDYANDRMD